MLNEAPRVAFEMSVSNAIKPKFKCNQAAKTKAESRLGLKETAYRKIKQRSVSENA